MEIKTPGITELAQASLKRFEQGEQSKRIFLGAGINDYETVSDLNYCVNDVEGERANYEGNPLWERNSEFNTLYDAEATKEGIRDSILQYEGQLTGKDTFVFYFSGHGTNWMGKSYLCPHDTNPYDPDSILSPEELAKPLKALAQDPDDPPKIVIGLDSCFAGGFTEIEMKSLKSLYPGTSEKTKMYKAYLNFIKSLEPPGVNVKFVPMIESVETPEDDFVEVLSEELSLDSIKGTKKMAGLSRVEIYASSQADETSMESHELEHGIYSYGRAEGAGFGPELGPADDNEDSRMSAKEIHEYAKQWVEAYVAENYGEEEAQHPIHRDKYRGNIWLKAAEDLFPKKKEVGRFSKVMDLPPYSGLEEFKKSTSKEKPKEKDFLQKFFEGLKSIFHIELK